MEQSMVNLAGEITALRFVLSVVVANNFARMPDGEEQLIAFHSAVERALRFRAKATHESAADDAQAIQTAALAAIERFFAETADRFVEIH